MTNTEMKKTFKERWNKLFPNKRLLAVQLNGFSHTIFYDEKSQRAKVVKGDCKTMHYSDFMSKFEANKYDLNSDNVIEFFKGFPNYHYQNNAQEIVFVKP